MSPLARTTATAKHGCQGCHDRAWNNHPSVPRDLQPMRCRGCPILALMRARGLSVNPQLVSVYGGYSPGPLTEGGE